jgi:hypothetical protein
VKERPPPATCCADWTSTSALHGIAVADGEPAYYLDNEGVKRFAPRPFHG